MVDRDIQNTIINSDKQSGGITAQHVTINNYSSWSKGLGKFNFYFKTKAIRWSLLGTLVLSCSLFVNSTLFSNQPITTKDQFHEFVSKYLASVSKGKEDAEEYFADKISIFYLERNIDPARVNNVRRTTDYKDGRYDIDHGSISLRGNFRVSAIGDSRVG